MKYLSSLEKKWFWITFGISAGVVLLYLILHWSIPGESRDVRLDEDQVAVVNAMLKSKEPDSVKKEYIINYLSITLGVDKDSVSEKPKRLALVKKEREITDGNKNNISLKELVNSFSLPLFEIILPSHSFEVKSPFWLKGSMAILEIIFWSLFGLAASVLYRGSEAIKNKDFDYRKVPVHLSKIIYAPLSSIVLFFSVDALILNQDISIVNINYWVIVLSFMFGFFSGRTIELLRRLKDLILPLGSDKEEGLMREGARFVVKGKVAFNPMTIDGQPGTFEKTLLKITPLKNPKAEAMYVEVAADGEFSTEALPEGDFLFYAQLTLTGDFGTRFFVREEVVKVNRQAELMELEMYLDELVA